MHPPHRRLHKKATAALQPVVAETLQQSTYSVTAKQNEVGILSNNKLSYSTFVEVSQLSIGFIWSYDTVDTFLSTCLHSAHSSTTPVIHSCIHASELIESVCLFL